MKKLFYSMFIIFLLTTYVEGQLLTQEAYNMNSASWSDPAPIGSEKIQLNNKLIPSTEIEENSQKANEILGKNLDGLTSDQKNSLIKGEIIRLSKIDVEITGELPQGAKLEGTTLKDKNGKPLVKMDKVPQGTDKVNFESQGLLKDSITYYKGGKPYYNTNLGPLESFQETGPASPRSAPEAGGGGSSGGGSGGIEEAFQQAMSFAQQAGQLLSGIADSLKSNGKRKTTTAQNNKGGLTATLEEEAAIALTKEEKEKLLAMQNDPAKPATIETSGSAPEAQITNANVLVPEQLAAKVNEETTLSLQGINGNDPNHPPLTDPTPVQLASVIPTQTSSITAAAIQENFGQYIKLLDHNLDVSGRDLVIYNLKTFNNIEAGGQDIQIFSGDIEIKIEGQRIMYPRLVKKAPYGIAQLSNKLDRENTFRLQHYENRKGLLYDNRQITSVGDVIVKHPQKNLIVSKIRGDMWEN